MRNIIRVGIFGAERLKGKITQYIKEVGAKEKRNLQQNDRRFPFGTPSRNRTDMSVKTLVFETSASTSSAIEAN